MTDWLIMIVVAALVLWLTSKAIFTSYFKAREDYWVRFVKTMKGLKDGKG